MNFNKYRIQIISLISSIIFILLLSFIIPDYLDKLEQGTIDYRFKFRGEIKEDAHIIQIDIDDTTIKELGKWPLKRFIHAKMVEILSRYKPRIIAFDILFSSKGDEAEDNLLIKATEAAGNVFYPLGFLLDEKEDDVLNIDEDALKLLERFTYFSNSKKGRPYYVSKAILPIRELIGAAKGIGHISATPDNDGVFRRTPLVVLLNNRYYPSIDFQIILDYLDIKPDNFTVELGNEIVLNRKIHIPIDNRGRMLINYAGKWSDTFKHYSFIDILKNSDDPELAEIFKDNICLISLTATGSTDIGPMPLESDFPLSGIHSNIINTVLTQNFLRETSFQTNLFILLLLSSVIAIISIFLSPFIFVLTTFGLISGYGLAAFLFFNKYGLILPLVLPTGAGVIYFIFLIVFKFTAGERERKKLESAFRSYFSPQMLKMIVEDPKILSLNGRRKELTVLFSDIVGFSTLSEKIAPEEVQILINEYFDEMTNIVFKYDGTVDKFMGDGMLAFFGDPVPNEGHALSAVRSAIDMQKKVKELQKKWANEGRYPFEIRIGINTGWVTVGNMGSKRRMEYTVLGEEVNLAQRLESNAKPGKVLIGNRTYSLIKDKINVLDHGEIHVKGKTEAVKIYEVAVEEKIGN